jgi:ABC-type dipeptide/oligopeptide/nickel transport system permease subunit
VSAFTWLALVASVLWTAVCVVWLRRRAGRARGDAGRRFFRYPMATSGLAVLVFFATIALAAPLLAPYPPWLQLDIVQSQNLPPSWLHPFGTDLYSRDVWSRLVYGARVSLGIGTLGMLVAVTLGALVGAIAGYFRRAVDAVLMRFVDVGLAVPRIFVVLVVIALWDRLALLPLVLLLGCTGWFPTSRLVRAEVLSLRERPFTEAARALGAGPWRVIFRHVLPNAAAPLIVSTALGIGNMMLLEAALSFLGVGVQAPRPSWGNMIADGREQFATALWTSLFPGLAIAFVVMALNAVGDGARDALDPRQESA